MKWIIFGWQIPVIAWKLIQWQRHGNNFSLSPSLQFHFVQSFVFIYSRPRLIRKRGASSLSFSLRTSSAGPPSRDALQTIFQAHYWRDQDIAHLPHLQPVPHLKYAKETDCRELNIGKTWRTGKNEIKKNIIQDWFMRFWKSHQECILYLWSGWQLPSCDFLWGKTSQYSR